MSLPLSVNQTWGVCRGRFRIQLIATKGSICEAAAATLHNAATGYNWIKDYVMVATATLYTVVDN